MNKLIILSMIISITFCQTSSTAPCTCTQLLSEGDCSKNSSLNCAWDTTKKTCAVSTTTTAPTVTYTTYCQDFSETDCPKAKPCETCGTYAACQWLDKKCSHFTGCTAHQKTTDGECQAISNRCITDGVHCIELGTCDSYLKQVPCIKNSNGKYCHWNTTDNKCEDAGTCDKLPTTLNTDDLCRAQITTCTTTTTGGCVDSGTGCIDQKLQVQCFWNKAMSQACYWTGTECKDKICDNAPTTMATDDACKGYLSTCTTKQGGGCITRTTCGAATIQAACIKNQGGSDCYWNGTTCLDKICSSAPTSMTTNTACAGFKSNCITKNGGGCVDNGLCSAANIAVACVKNTAGVDCIFDNNTCKEKTCTNAPTSNNTHELCQSFLSSCTVKSGGGCQPKTCTNAPITLTQNSDCETYLPKNNCISKQGGGCEQLSNCSSISLEANCIKNLSGGACVFNGTCKDKTCANSPDSNNTHELCNQYSPSCTVNNGKCVDKTCENTLTEAICTTDLNNKACIWKGSCFAKQCVFAPSSITTVSDCQAYKSSCTLSDSGSGCIEMPLKCEIFTSEGTCTFRKNIVNNVVSKVTCAWNGTTCLDKSCATALKSITDNNDCGTYLSGCVLANSGTGCQDLPATCGARKQQVICSFETGPACVWNTSTNACVDRTCATATTDGIVGKLDTVNAGNCGTYFNCILNNDGSACMAKPTSCSGLGSANCGAKAKADGGDCIWLTSVCKDLTCANLTYTTQDDCSAKGCVLKNDKSGCQPFADCTTYTIIENCQVNASKQSCSWNANTLKCENKSCLNAPQTANFDSAEKCAAFGNSAGQTCTLAQSVAAYGGCAQKLSKCDSYTQEAACHKTISNQGTDDDCVWSNGVCGDKPAAQPTNCDSIGPDQLAASGSCAAVNSHCIARASGMGCRDIVCSDYTGNTKAACENQDSKCTVGSTGQTNTCQDKEATCAAYSEAPKCSFSGEGNCQVSQGDGSCGVSTDDGFDCGNWYGLHCSDYSILCKSADSATWETACVKNGCDQVSADSVSFDQCLKIDCSPVVAYNSCTVKKDTCAEYTQQNCVFSMTATTYCNWDGSACKDFDIDSQTCGDISSDNIQAMCGLKSKAKCYYNSDSSKCVKKETQCTAYTTQDTCGYAGTVKCYWNGALATNKCFSVQDGSNCANIIGTNLDHSYCQNISGACTSNKAGTACQEQADQCTTYTATSCTVDASGYCTQSQAIDSGATCLSITDSTACNNIFPGQGKATHAKCDSLKSGCTNNGADACGVRTCANATNKTGATFDKTFCSAWAAGCVPNLLTGATSCIPMNASCSDYSVAACSEAQEGPCFVQNNQCASKSCGKASPLTNTTHAQCEAYASYCTIARVGGCQARTACTSYPTIGQCSYNDKNAACHWNVILKTCVEAKCENLEANASFDSASKCEALQCVIKASGSGCQARGLCSTYNQTQCTKTSVNTNGGSCVWNTNLTTPACQDKSCSTAANSITDPIDCSEYFTGCTVAATVDATTNTPTYAGCMPRTSCSSYVAEKQCTFSDKKGKCGWNGSKCDDFSCLTAPATDSYNTHDACHTYKTGCTVNSTKQGCITIPDKCEGMIQEQCLYDSDGNQCNWQDASSTCVTRTCDNAPDTVTDAAGCAGYLSICTKFDEVKCQTKVCEDFVLTTDALCKVALSTCTSDGVSCVKRGTCAQAQTSVGCVKSSTNQDCEWVVPTSGTAYCTIKNCTTAPATLTSETSCASYYPGCTTKSGGGCVVKSTCSAATVQSACTKSSLNVECAWDVDKCRDKDCQDFKGTTHSACKLQRSNCTAGLNGNCARIQTCENTQVHSACIEGTNGPCLWVAGACYSYQSCKSLSWASNSLCKQISSQCTTDGSKCVGITSCAETNVSGGCVTGYDGDCIQSVPSLDSTDTKCKLYTSCADAFYLTHAQCQTASYKCTTNKTTGCIPLSACSSYNNDESCKINDKGTVLTNNKVTSTGICTWDATASTCKDQVCSDLTLTTHFSCNSSLSTCTSDGTNCINQGNCQTYTTDSACNNGLGLDGTCFWVAQNGTTAAICRVKTCDDVQNGTTTPVCQAGLSTCISDGTKCVPYSTCSTFKTQVSCNYGGSDGICVWKSTTSGTTTTGTCSLMTSCASAASDQNACNAAKLNCNWIPAVTGTKPVASKCETHTCATYQSTNQACSRFFSWDSKLQQICTNVNGVCQATDPTTLAQIDCYNSAVTGYSYTWNASTSKCGVCTNPTTTPNQTNNTVNNDTTTVSGKVMSILIVALGYVLI